jgi:hypothetical protein
MRVWENTLILSYSHTLILSYLSFKLRLKLSIPLLDISFNPYGNPDAYFIQ